jgi:ATP-dependent DNA helicase RecG
MILPYRGLGSGIKRALDAWPEIDFIDDRHGCLFTATVHRKAKTSSRKMNALPGGLGKTSGNILTALKQDVNLTVPELASLIEITERSKEFIFQKPLQ